MNSFSEIKYPGWELVRKIGSGRFGTVYEIERDVSGYREQAALKVISLPQNEEDIYALRCEGYDEKSIAAYYEGSLHDLLDVYNIMAEMKGCANVVYYDDIRTIPHKDGLGWDIYIRMELLTPLQRYVNDIIADEQVIRIGRDICNALSFCEKKKIIHRDIKPQNIFVSEDGTFRLGDFGIAMVLERRMIGARTDQYMAPEIYNNKRCDPKADIYSLGLVLYWLLNMKRLPFLPLPPAVPGAGDEEEARKKRFSGKQVPPPCNGSEQLKRIVLKACACDPKDRFWTPEEFAEELKYLSDYRNGEFLYRPAREFSEDLKCLSNYVKYISDYGNGEFLVLLRCESYAVRFERMEERTKVYGFVSLNQSDKFFLFRAGSAELKVTVDSYENEKIVLSVIELSACQDNNLLRQITLTTNEMKFCYGEPGLCDASIGYEIGWWKSYEEFTHFMEIRFKKENTHIEQVWELKQHKNRLKGLLKWLRF